jgi:hypothetical protein
MHQTLKINKIKIFQQKVFFSYGRYLVSGNFEKSGLHLKIT